jgi:hypothetical protein
MLIKHLACRLILGGRRKFKKKMILTCFMLNLNFNEFMNCLNLNICVGTDLDWIGIKGQRECFGFDVTCY